MTSSEQRMPKWKRFEEFVASLQQHMAPGARIAQNDMIMGRSGTTRQIDVSVRQSVGQFHMLAVIDCKDWKRPVDIADVGSFADMVEDVRANKGAIVCNAGFTEGAKKRAMEKGIDLLMAVDTESVEWPAKLEMPTLCHCTYIKSFSFCFRVRGARPFVIPTGDPRCIEVYREDRSLNNILFNLLASAWNAGELSTDVGTHTEVKFLHEPAYVRVKDNYYGPVEITATIDVGKKVFFGNTLVEKGQGFMDGITGAFTTHQLRWGVNWAEVEEKWRRLETEAELAIQPCVVLHASDCLPIIDYSKEM